MSDTLTPSQILQQNPQVAQQLFTGITASNVKQSQITATGRVTPIANTQKCSGIPPKKIARINTVQLNAASSSYPTWDMKMNFDGALQLPQQNNPLESILNNINNKVGKVKVPFNQNATTPRPVAKFSDLDQYQRNQMLNQSSAILDNESDNKGFNPAQFFGNAMNRIRSQAQLESRQTVMKSTIADDTTEVFGKPTITELEDKKMQINEEHMEEVISKGVNVYNKGPNPEPEDPKDEEEEKEPTDETKAKMKEAMENVEKGLIDKEVNPNMEVGLEAIHMISTDARKQQDKFKAMYEEIKGKIEKGYGKGNGDYEIYDKDNLYELVPERLPIDEDEANLVKKLVDYIVFLIDALYDEKPYQRFYVLETIARVPYFSYISCLHYLETIGFNDNIGWLRIHWAEGWNELHHLLIMEELGGNRKWFDRFLAQHTAVLYYWTCVVLYFIKPNLAYNLSEQIEKHAYETYDKFLLENAENLKTLPAPKIAKEYYEQKTFMFDDFQSCREPGTRRPIIRNLYDVFFNIRNDEAEHFKTMIEAQDQLYAKENPQLLSQEMRDKFAAPKTINGGIANPYNSVDSDNSGNYSLAG